MLLQVECVLLSVCLHYRHPPFAAVLAESVTDMIRYDTIVEFNVDSKAEYTA